MFSVIIPVHDQLAYLAYCLDSVASLTAKPYRIVVVDDGSGKETRAFCELQRRRGIIHNLVRNDKPQGFSLACNEGMRVSALDGSEYYCLLNSDAEVGTKDWNDKIIAASQERDAALVGVISNSAGVQSVPLEHARMESARAYDNILERVTKRARPYTKFVHGFCYIIRSDLYEAMGGFNAEKYPHYGSEDDYTWQAIHSGFKAIICDDVFVAHACNKSYGDAREKIVEKTIPMFIEQWGREAVQAAIDEQVRALAPLKSDFAAEILRLQYAAKGYHERRI